MWSEERDAKPKASSETRVAPVSQIFDGVETDDIDNIIYELVRYVE